MLEESTQITPLSAWDLKRPDVPPRSKLFCLEPIGVGTAQTESLTGYISRLAQEHCLSFVGLLKIIGSSDSDLKGVHLRVSGLYAIDGADQLATTLVAAVQKLTRRQGLQHLTMLAWQNVLPRPGLLRTNKAWCPECLNDDAKPYSRLLWSLSTVRVCPIHHCPLQETCPACHNRVHATRALTRPGFCSRCIAWLGGRKGEESPLLVGAWSAESTPLLERATLAGQLLAAAASVACPVNGASLAHSIASLAGRFGENSIYTFARKLGVHKTTFLHWCQGVNLPTLGKLLDVCRATGIAPADLLIPQREEPVTPVGLLNKSKTDLFLGTPRKSRIAFDAAKIRFILEQELRETCGETNSLDAVCRRTGTSRQLVSRYFPELAIALVERHRTFQRANRQARNESLQQQIRLIAKRLENAGIRPTGKKIGPHLRGHSPRGLRSAAAQVTLRQLHASGSSSSEA